MSMKVQWSGLDEFLREFGSIPKEVHADGMSILVEETEGAAAEMRNAYGAVAVTGTLANRVRTVYPSTEILIGLVQSRAPHSHLYEWGTKMRKTLTGANRGKMPAAKPAVVVPIARRRRNRMSRRLVEMLRAMGFEIGTA